LNLWSNLLVVEGLNLLLHVALTICVEDLRRVLNKLPFLVELRRLWRVLDILHILVRRLERCVR
jgi:hypothetical protein